MLNDDGAKAVRRLVTLAPGAAAGPIRAAEYRRCRIDQADCAPEAGAARRGFQQTRDGPRPVALMEALGFGRFAVVGHDRGARVAYRMALDHPERVERLAVLNVIPTVDQFERMTGGPSLGYWPWFLLALPAPFPEQLIAAAPEQFLRFVFDSWTADPTAIDDDAFAVYLAAFSPAAAAICADYRASFWLDYEHDAMIDGSAGTSSARRSSSPEPRRHNSPTASMSGANGHQTSACTPHPADTSSGRKHPKAKLLQAFLATS